MRFKLGDVMKFNTLKELVNDRATKMGNNTFLVSPKNEDNISFYEFKQEVDRIEEILISNGIKKGDKVSIVLKNGIEFSTSFFGITNVGGVVVPINTALKGKELEYLLKNSDSKYIITNKEFLSYMFNDVVVLSKENIYRGLVLIKLTNSQGDDSFDNSELTKKDLALILYTSGTTGKPKGVMLTHENLLAEAEHISTAHKLSSEDIALCILPLFHINGLVITLITPLYVGMKVIMPEKFSASLFWGWIDKYRVTWFSAVPTILSIILSKETPDKLDLSCMRFARSASAALPVAVIEEFQNRFHIQIIEAYGISEGASQITTNPVPPQKTKFGSVGFGFGNEIKIVDEYNNETPAFKEGEIFVKGDNVAIGYYKNEASTKEAFVDGWFHTGDIGYFDGDGFLFLSGRKKELINRAGEKFSPREIDEILYMIPEIELAATVGVPNSLYGEEVVAYIRFKDNQTLEVYEIMDFCKERLAYFKVPKEIFFVNEFPQGANGKIQRLKLVKIYEEKNINKESN